MGGIKEKYGKSIIDCWEYRSIVMDLYFIEQIGGKA